MKCQRLILQVKWHQFVRNVITATTGLPSMHDIISRRRNALFGHIARLDSAPSSPIPRRPVTWPTGSVDRTGPAADGRKDDDAPAADLWRCAVSRGHGASLLVRLATRYTTTTTHHKPLNHPQRIHQEMPTGYKIHVQLLQVYSTYPNNIV